MNALTSIASLAQFQTIKARSANDPLSRMKANFIEGLTEYLEILDADKRQETYKGMRIMYQKDEATGKGHRIGREKCIRRWWLRNRAGHAVTIYYGNKPLLSEAVQVDEHLASVRNVLNAVLEVVEKGELDAAFRHFAETHKFERKPKKPAEPANPAPTPTPEPPAAEETSNAGYDNQANEPAADQREGQHEQRRRK